MCNDMDTIQRKLKTIDQLKNEYEDHYVDKDGDLHFTGCSHFITIYMMKHFGRYVTIKETKNKMKWGNDYVIHNVEESIGGFPEEWFDNGFLTDEDFEL